jgi:hypothetical protein
MPATRNNLPINFGGITIQPAGSSIQNGTVINLTNQVTSPGASTGPATTANFISPIELTSDRNLQTIMSPVTCLNGVPDPYVASPVIFVPKPNPVVKLIASDGLEETLALETYTLDSGQAVLNPSTLRIEIVTELDFKPIYALDGMTETTFGRYFDDLYQTSVVQDTLRKYLITNLAAFDPNFAVTLGKISSRVNKDIADTKQTIAYLDSLLQKIKEISLVMDVKKNLSNSFVFQAPSMPIKEFFLTRMLYSEQSYDQFADTKVVYQLLSDLLGILGKCSFNLIDNFTDADRAVYTSNPKTTSKQISQDSITVDLTYGNNLRYTSANLRQKYIDSLVSMNGVLSALPTGVTNKLKFTVNLLSKELRVSKALGKYNMPEGAYFGFNNQGDPFPSMLGTVPNDIFLEPLGQAGMAGMFYIKTGARNVVVLPFESRQVVGDNETVFVPGATYFGDRIFRGDFSVYNNYRENFSTKVTNLRNAFDKLLLNQTSYDSTSKDIEPRSILNSCLSLYSLSQNHVRSVNSDASNLATFLLFLSAGSNINIKFELFKLILLIACYDTRSNVTQATLTTDNFRSLLFSELGQQTIQGFTGPATEANLATLLNQQIEIVKTLFLANAPTLSSGQSSNLGLERNEANALLLQEQAASLGLDVPVLLAERRNTSLSNVQISTQQFSELIYALRGENNLIKNVIDIAKLLFNACSDNDIPYHLVNGGSSTRYNGMTMTTYMLLVFDLFSDLVSIYARPNISFSVLSYAASAAEMCQMVQLSFVGRDLDKISQNISSFVNGQNQTDRILKDFGAKLTQEDETIDNIVLFFERLNQQLSNISSMSDDELKTLARTFANNPSNISTTRTAKGIFSNIISRASLYNPTNNPNLAFYLPASKTVSDKNFAALKRAMMDARFLSPSKKILTIGIPFGFAGAAVGAKLSKSDVYSGDLKESPSDVININIYRLSKNDEGIIFKPLTYRFDLSLFPKGFDNVDGSWVNSQTYEGLINGFQFSDFDESHPFSEVVPETLADMLRTNDFYNMSTERKNLGTEVATNLMNSFLLDLYGHMATGLNTGEETFIKYTQSEISVFTKELAKVTLGTADLTRVKFMPPEYGDLLNAFRSNTANTKLMLSLCNDIPSVVFREKEYDRVFNLMIDPADFALDINAMLQQLNGKEYLGYLWGSRELYEEGGEVYKVYSDFNIDQYFVNVEIIK